MVMVSRRLTAKASLDRTVCKAEHASVGRGRRWYVMEAEGMRCFQLLLKLLKPFCKEVRP